MAIASGLFRVLTYKVEATYGTKPVGTAAQALRRVEATFGLSKDTYQSDEIRTDFQVADFRHGVRRVAGSLSGELSAGSYKDFIAAALKKAFVATTAITGASITIAGTAPNYTLTRAAGSYLTDGIKIGDIVRLTAGAFAAPNLNKNLLVTALSATVCTVLTLNGSALTAEGPIASATMTVPGKKSWVPATGHTDLSYSVESWHSDVPASEVYTGCKVAGVKFDLPPTGMAKIGVEFVGQNIDTAAGQYFTSPTAATSTGVMAAVNGIVRVGGVTVATLTGLSVDVSCAQAGDPVVGANTIPNLFPGRVLVSGQMTAYFESTTLRDVFINETEISIIGAFTASNDAAADFMTFVLPRVKLGGAGRNDGDAGLVQTMPFTALMNTAGGAGISSEATTISTQDSQA